MHNFNNFFSIKIFSVDYLTPFKRPKPEKNASVYCSPIQYASSVASVALFLWFYSQIKHAWPTRNNMEQLYPPEAFQEKGSQNSRINICRPTRGPRTLHSHGDITEFWCHVRLYVHSSMCEGVMNTFCSRPLIKLTPTRNSASLELYPRDGGQSL